MSSDGNVVVLENVRKDFEIKGRSIPVRALRGATLNVQKGSMVAVVGYSGSGKTTLLYMLGALDIPTSGLVNVNGRDLSKMKEKDLTEYRARTIGFVFQTFNLIPNLTSLENVELPMEALNVSKQERRKKALDLLKAVDMQERVDYKPLKLSGGEQQRVAIARALANDPSIILADEPTGNLDSKTGQSIIELLDRLRKERGTTVIIVTHSDSAARACDFTFFIEDGVIASKKDLRMEDQIQARKKSLRADLLISGRVASKLVKAGYFDVETIGRASVEELSEVLDDFPGAQRLVEKAKIVMDQGEAMREAQKKMLGIDLSLSEEHAKRLFDAGYGDIETIGSASVKKLTEILGDEKTAESVVERAELLILKDDQES